MRATINTFSYNGGELTIELNTGGAVGATHLVIVEGTDWVVNRWFYYDEFHPAYGRNFGKKVIDDDTYREESLAGETAWARTADIYEPAARRIYDPFDESELTSYTAGEEDQEVRYRNAMSECRAICHEVFGEVKGRVRNEQSLDGLDAFVQDRVDQAHETVDRLRPVA